MEKVLSPTRAIIQRQGDDPARHLQLYGHDLRSRRHRGRQEGARRIRLGHDRQPRPQRHLSGPQGMRGGAEGILRHRPRHGLLDRLPGQSRPDRRPSPARSDYIILDADSHASIYDGCALGNAEIVRFRHNNVEDLDKRLGRLPAEARQAGRARGRLFDARRHRAAEGDGRGRQEARRDGRWSTRRIGMGFFGAQRPRRVRGSRASRTRSISSSAPSPSRSARSAASVVSNHPKFEVLRLVCRPYVFTASLPPWWSPPPRPRSAS